ncbi:MAG: hypothetical protein HY741_10725 [Chloroflexi bacterium]|nr:hypothetical protein [Chloroflexota bacterium]
MADQKDLPLTLELPMNLRALVYPTPEGGRGVIARGSGFWTLRFEATRDKNIARVRIKDISVALDPLFIPFDIDRDGMLECIEVDDLRLTARDFDLRRSGGEYDFRTGYITLNIRLVVRPDFLPQYKEFAAQPIPFQFQERGWLDLTSGRFKTDAGTWTIPDGPLAGLSIVGDQFTTEIPCSATLSLGVGLKTSSFYGKSAKQAPKKVWKCAKTPIILLWQATNCTQVDIQPLLGVKNLTGYQELPDISNPTLKDPVMKSTAFTGETQGECDSVTDEVNVYVVGEGEEISQTATYEPEYKFWTAQLPDHTYDQNIKVSQIIIDSGKSDSITHPRWRVDHVFSGAATGTEIPALNNWTNLSKVHALPGEYRFTPRLASGSKLPSGEEKRIIYFRLKGGCKW